MTEGALAHVGRQEGVVVTVRVDRDTPLWLPGQCLSLWSKAVRRVLPVEDDQLVHVVEGPNEASERLGVDRIVGSAAARSLRDGAEVEGD